MQCTWWLRRRSMWFRPACTCMYHVLKRNCRKSLCMCADCIWKRDQVQDLNNQYVLWLIVIILHMILRHPGIELLELVSLEINHTHKWSWGPVYASHVLAPWIKSQLLPPCLPFSHNYRSFTWRLVLGTSSLWITTITSLTSHQRQTSLPAWDLAYVNIVVRKKIPFCTYSKW